MRLISSHGFNGQRGKDCRERRNVCYLILRIGNHSGPPDNAVCSGTCCANAADTCVNNYVPAPSEDYFACCESSSVDRFHLSSTGPTTVACCERCP